LFKVTFCTKAQNSIPEWCPDFVIQSSGLFLKTMYLDGCEVPKQVGDDLIR